MARTCLPCAALAACLLLPSLSGYASPAAETRDRLVVCADATDPPTLDPHKAFSEKNHTVNHQVFEGLVRFDPQGRIEPALAVSWERLDPLTMRFHLRKGVRFHNGEPFNAEAVRFSIARILDPTAGFPGTGLMIPLDKAEVIDENTVDLKTSRPDGLLLRRLAALVLIVPPRHVSASGGKALAGQPIGTGAFRFKSWEPGRSILLAANPDYWMKGYPKVAELEFRFIPRQEQLRELFAGRVDLLTDIPGTKTSEVQRHRGTEVRKGRTYYTTTCNLRFDRGPLADRRVRRALNYALNRGNLVRYDLLGNGTPVASLSMPGEEGHDPSLRPYPYDLKKAAALLAEAGYPKGFTLHATVKDSAERTAKIIAAGWKQIGVDLKIDLMTEAELIDRFRDPKYDLAIGDVPDPMGHIYFLPSLGIYSKSPFSFSKDDKFDALLEEMVATIDEQKALDLAKALDRYIHSEALSIFTYQRLKLYAARKGVSFEHYVTGTPLFYAARSAQ